MDGSYTALSQIFISEPRATRTQTGHSKTEDKGINCNTLRVRLIYANKSSDSLFLLYSIYRAAFQCCFLCMFRIYRKLSLISISKLQRRNSHIFRHEKDTMVFTPFLKCFGKLVQVGLTILNWSQNNIVSRSTADRVYLTPLSMSKLIERDNNKRCIYNLL